MNTQKKNLPKESEMSENEKGESENKYLSGDRRKKLGKGLKMLWRHFSVLFLWDFLPFLHLFERVFAEVIDMSVNYLYNG